MWKKQKIFDIENVSSLIASDGGVGVDIGFLRHEAHENAFIEIFVKFIEENKIILCEYEDISISAKKALSSAVSCQINEGGIKGLILNTEVIARDLYQSHNDMVIFELSGENDKKLLRVFFDNPYFEFE
ncbi:MAG: hypothetical protein BMS9Abin33_0332 [Gammaproteobacteria bacterium]|nr:MAG: hypothetical protein BMS9Abin33_0332 [Gammaproteobacteria bacterium]